LQVGVHRRVLHASRLASTRRPGVDQHLVVLETDHDGVVLGDAEHQPRLVALALAPVIALLARLGALAEVLRTRRRDQFGKLIGEIDGVDLDVIDVLRVLHAIEEVPQALLGLALLDLADEAIGVVLGRLLAQAGLEVWKLV
jgi:hypothetical protein